MAPREVFSSHWAVILAGLGMAVGTGNLWRFPRIAAENGGAAFLIPWFIFLFIWSFPLLIAELSIGRTTRRGTLGSFARLAGDRFAWMGGFVAVVTIMILFYYSVVTGWTLKYALASITGQLHGVEPGAYWETYAASIWQPIFFHVVAALVGGWVIQRGVVRGIERANQILVPVLFVLLIVAALRAVTLPGATVGLEFMFNPDLSSLSSYRTWLEALTQSAWSTGAGWGLLLTYGIYLRRDENVVLSGTTIGFGDNSASLLAGMAVLPAAFAILPLADAQAAMAAGNEGLMFVWIPQVFERMPAGALFLPLFFIALFCAALSSLIAMIELASRILIDGGISRRTAVTIVTAVVIVCGMPSAISLEVFRNQDWVWGIGLMISGLFISLGVTLSGSRQFRDQSINPGAGSFRVGPLFEWVLKYLVPAEFVVMFSWWMYQAAVTYDPEGWWNPLHTFSVGTCVAQWGVVILLLLAFNRWMARTSTRQIAEGEP